MYFNGINSQIFLHENCGFSDEFVQKLQDESEVPLYPLTQWHQCYKSNMKPIILVDYNDPTFDPIDFENPSLPGQNINMVITQAPLHLKTTDLLKYGRIRGIFYKQQSFEDSVNAIQALSKGHSWLSSSVNEQLLSYYQSVLIRYAPPHTINLTRREMEVLEALRIGKSNYGLAEQLFISEHTIKSHLYKIFRKIKVKNREEAVLWAHHFLP
ncbi:helix-turn-helix transcriptional regulator [Vibrio sp. UCD-FRSSP16_10]|uniref:response regulator transcription factor n=1 Tax=unclassified Vibrio TaxID=2614977 RepID=UPI0007FDEE9B|nr:MULTISPECIES: response regulator transcription factor [unclassified Vibrio]OBT17453.1 helix-turn-helix transcriptional regulator [Vibrio sp. UCD-FRSSP16_30]OBT23222.1 helix-turn-helix transcriptional regulator [Vibrio sp. UCD-FRSSP16_10]